MLHLALQFLGDELSDYVSARSGLAPGGPKKVKLGAVVDATGKYAFGDNLVGVSVINVEEERTTREQLPSYAVANGQMVEREPRLKLNVFVLFAANFQDYAESLKVLSHVMTFFQTRRSFAQDNYPALDPRIEKMVMDLQSLGFDQLNQIWTYLGGKYLPSVVYKLRLIVLDPDEVSGVGPPITRVNATIHQR